MFELLNRPEHHSKIDAQNHRVSTIHKLYQQLATASQNKRARDVAKDLGITEAQWVASQCGGLRSIPLAGKPLDIFSQLGRLGRVMALTRNPWCVHERHGSYLNIRPHMPVGLVLGPDIDLRMFFSTWSHVWAVEESGRSSLQFFDQAGDAIHKVYCTAHSHASEYVSIVGEYASAEAIWPVPVMYPADVVQHELDEMNPLGEHPAGNRGLGRFRQAWLAMKDTHDFYPLLKTFNISRTGALKAAGEDLAKRITPEAVEDLLYCVARSGLPIMCFVGNRGMLQIHSGSVLNIRRTGRWLNILDVDFNLHLDTTKIDSAWIVRKPTVDGWVTSMELFAQTGELIVQFFGARKPGIPEQTAWTDLLTALSLEPLTR